MFRGDRTKRIWFPMLKLPRLIYSFANSLVTKTGADKCTNALPSHMLSDEEQLLVATLRPLTFGCIAVGRLNAALVLRV